MSPVTARALEFRGDFELSIPATSGPVGLYNSRRFAISDALRRSALDKLSEAPAVRAIRRIFFTSHAPRISELIEAAVGLERAEYHVCKECFYRFDEVRVVENISDVPGYIKSRGQTKYSCEFVLPKAKAKASAEKLEKLGFKRSDEWHFTLESADIADRDAETRLTEVVDATRRIAGAVIFRAKRNIAALKTPSICPLCAGAAKKMKTAPETIAELSGVKSPRLRAFAEIAKRLGVEGERLTTQLTQDREELSFAINVALGLARLREREAVLLEEPTESSRSAQYLALMQECAADGIKVFFTSPKPLEDLAITWVDCGAHPLVPVRNAPPQVKGAAREITIDGKTSVDPDMPVACILSLDQKLADIFSRQLISKTEGYTSEDFLEEQHPACSTKIYAGHTWYEIQSLNLSSVLALFKATQLQQLSEIINALGLGHLRLSDRAESLSPRELALLTAAFALNHPAGSRVTVRGLKFLTAPERQVAHSTAAALRIKLFI